MRKSYILSFDPNDESSLNVVRVSPDQIDRNLFRGVTEEISLPKDLKLYADSGESTDLVGGYLGWMIISKRMMEEIEGYSTGVQFLDAPLFDENDQLIDGYYLANVMNDLGCLNESESDISYFKSGRRMGIVKYAINADLIPEDVFVYTIKTCNATFVTQEVADVIISCQLRGIALIETVTTTSKNS